MNNFDPTYYVSLYEDLQNVFQNNDEIYHHWITYGKEELRISSVQVNFARKLLDYFGIDENFYIQQISTNHPVKHWLYEGYFNNLNLTPKHKIIQDEIKKNNPNWNLYKEYYTDIGKNLTEEECKIHYLIYGYNEGRIYPKNYDTIENWLMEELQESKNNLIHYYPLLNILTQTYRKNNLFHSYNYPLINILTRTYRRPNLFKKCRNSIEYQNYPRKHHIIGYDEENTLNYICFISNENCPSDIMKVEKIPILHKDHYPYNLYLNNLITQVKEGWVLILDDDDELVSSQALNYLVTQIKSEMDMLCWRFWTPRKIIPDSPRRDGLVKQGQIASCGAIFPINYWSHDIKFDDTEIGDFNFLNHMSLKTHVKWLNEIVTKTNQETERSYGKSELVASLDLITGIENT